MTRALVSHWKILLVGILAVSLIAGLATGIPLANAASDNLQNTALVDEISPEEVTTIEGSGESLHLVPVPLWRWGVRTTTDQLIYEPGEGVSIDITNIRLRTITGGGVSYSVYDLRGNNVAGLGIYLIFEWKHSEGLSFFWDQINYDGEQVDSGIYILVGQAGHYSDATLIYIS
jgi:hypothetical protein